MTAAPAHSGRPDPAGGRSRPGSAPDAPVHVVSAVISSPAAPDRILVGVRRPSRVAARHPGVVSTPTVALPAALFELITGPDGARCRTPGMWPVDGAATPLGGSGHTGSAAAFVLEALLCRKLGLAGALVDGSLTGTARPRMIALDRVGDPLGTGLPEWTLMLTYAVRLTRGVEAVPAATGSYSRLFWAPAGRLARALAHRDALHLDDSLNPFEVCVDGLCLRVAAAMLDNRPAPPDG